MNILLVEDNDLDVEILKRVLRKIESPAALVCAKNGMEALQLLKDDQTQNKIPRPFAILLDINMPRMNGHEFLEALRTTDGLCDAQVIIFTTSDNKKDVDLAYKNNATGYIVKPNSTSELAGILETLQKFWALCETSTAMMPDRAFSV